ncbi:MAG: hypothetical protein ACLUEV_10120 [Alistipes sp.]
MTPEDPISPFQSLAIGQWGGILAYNTYVLDPVGDNYYAPWNNLRKTRDQPVAVQHQQGKYRRIRHLRRIQLPEYPLPRIYGRDSGYLLPNENNYSETYSNNTLPLNRLNYIRTLRQDGTGVNFKFGAILRPVDNLRIGVASIRRPTSA